MGILRIRENLDDLIERDPYELFHLEEPHQLARRLRPEFWGAAVVGVLAAFVIAVITFLNWSSASSESADMPYAYFEIRAIDPEGRPAAGAIVSEGERQLGVTDSFGEWRRFMRVKPGSTVGLHITKRIGDVQLAAVKNVAVPLQPASDGDMEITGSVQLLRMDTREVIKEPAAASPVRAASKDAPESGVTASRVDVEASASVTAAMTASDTVWLPNSVWPMVQGQGAGGAKADESLGVVLDALRRRSRELGMRIDPQSPWRLKLSTVEVGQVPADTAKALILVEGTRVTAAGETRLYSYLRNFQETPLKTARDILWATTLHFAVPHQVARLADGVWSVEATSPALWALAPGRAVLDAQARLRTVEAKAGVLTLSGSEPACQGERCTVMSSDLTQRAPISGWRRLKLKVLGDAARADIYVAGYAARRLDGGVYEYWGPEQGGANLTVLRDGRLVHRGRIEPKPGVVPIISLPSEPLSRR